MDSIKFEDELQVAEHQFRILTELKNSAVTSSVLENQHLLFQKQTSIDAEFVLDEDQVWDQRAQKVHKRFIDEIRSLFDIKERIATVTQPNYRYRFGRLLMAYNFIDEAKKEFEEAIKLKSDFTKAYRKLAACYLKEHNFPSAVSTLLKAKQISENFPDVWNDLGVAYTFNKEYEKARDCFLKAQKMKPDFPEANFNFGILLLVSSYQEESDQKLAIPVRLIRSLKDLRNATYFNDQFWKARVDYVLEKISDNDWKDIFPNLIDLQLKLITRDDPVLLKFDFFFLKFIYGKTKMDDASIEFYESWLNENVQKFKYADYWNDFGIIHLIQCRSYFLNALEEIEKAHQLNPQFKEATENLEKIKRIKNGFLILLRALLKN